MIYHEIFYDTTSTSRSIMCYNLNPVEFWENLGDRAPLETETSIAKHFVDNSLGVFYIGNNNSYKRCKALI